MRARHLVVLIGLLAGCGSGTQLVNTWKDPTAPATRFHKVLAVCACKDPGIRRTVEDRLASAIGGQPSYRVLTEAQFTDPAAAKAAIAAAGFDGIVVMRLASVDKSFTYVPGAAYVVPAGYASPWGYWGYGAGTLYGTVYDPGYVQQDQLVNVDTNVYSVADDKLVWASRSQTANTSSIPKLVDDIVAETAKAMKKQHVLQ